jgi:membrane associated rhomboid family serine protease
MEIQPLNLNPCYRWIVWSCYLTSLQLCYRVLLLLNLLKQWVVAGVSDLVPLHAWGVHLGGVLGSATKEL